jgi:hypothetical protein
MRNSHVVAAISTPVDDCFKLQVVVCKEERRARSLDKSRPVFSETRVDSAVLLLRCDADIKRPQRFLEIDLHKLLLTKGKPSRQPKISDITT